MNQAVPPPPIPFIDLGAQRRRLGRRIDEAVARVIDSTAYILGPEVQQVEADLAAFCGAKHVISCSNGTDALALVLMARGVGPGQAILCPSFTYAATAEVVARAGATPVFLDVHEDTFNLDPAAIGPALQTARDAKLEPVGIILVDLFGQAADYDRLLPVCEQAGLWVLCDAAQSFGASYKGQRVGKYGIATTTSFFPAKPLGCYGDGGAIFTDDAELDATLRSLRFHGLGPERGDHVRIGMTGRLDTIQAAVLIEKLKIFEDEIAARNAIARRYDEGLAEVAKVPFVLDGCTSTWAQYTIRVAPERRDSIAASLKARGIPTAVYYSKPLHQQTAYKTFPIGGNGLPVTDRLAQEVISLPMHPYLDEATQALIIDAVRTALA
jgi:dTDP-4-amino-4,6-dideoxygalactose transaminase